MWTIDLRYIKNIRILLLKGLTSGISKKKFLKGKSIEKNCHGKQLLKILTNWIQTIIQRVILNAVKDGNPS